MMIMYRLLSPLVLVIFTAACASSTSGPIRAIPPGSAGPPVASHSASATPVPATSVPAATDIPPAVIPYTNPLTVTGHYPPHCRALTSNGLPIPDRVCTPGAVGDRVTQATVTTTICVPNWTATIRPSLKVTEPVKTAAMLAYGIPRAQRGKVEFDHLVPLSLGGADDTANLWPQLSDLPGAGFANSKDTVERVLVAAVCHRVITLDQARRAIVTDWTTARARLKV